MVVSVRCFIHTEQLASNCTQPGHATLLTFQQDCFQDMSKLRLCHLLLAPHFFDLSPLPFHTRKLAQLIAYFHFSDTSTSRAYLPSAHKGKIFRYWV
jgi:hypothetical protein